MPTDWDDHYQRNDTPWDKGAPAPPLLEWLAQPGHFLAGDVLVPGCGFGHDVRAIAAAGRPATICGLDVSPAALARARQQPAVGAESYLEADLFNLPPELRGRFDWVFEHTCFCAIDPARRPEYVDAVAAALRPGGRLLAIFYLTPWHHGESAPPGGGPPFGATKDELDRLFAPRFDLLEQWTPTRAYPGREGRELMRLFRRST
jgi:SAM-dependent methyltransferase